MMCSTNERFTDKIVTPEIFVISGVISFGNPFGNLCSGKVRFTNAYWYSIFIRELKHCVRRGNRSGRISLSISIREPKPQDIVDFSVVLVLHTYYNSIMSLLSSRFSCSIRSPARISIEAYCFSVTIIALTAPLEGTWLFITA